MQAFRKTALAISVAALLPGVAVAQQLEEVLVTATKREATVQDLPFSVNAQTQRDIVRQNASTLEDLSRNVAGLTIQNLGPGQSQVAIRGVSAGEVRRDQPGVKEQVGVYLDESVISLSLFTPDIDLFDLNRVETLRGPQGTLFGSGSIGGTVRFITNQPFLDAVEGDVELDGNFVEDGDDPGGHVKGMINVPIGDSLAVRAVGYSTRYAGYIDALKDRGTGSTGYGLDEDVNTGNRWGGRIALLWEATDRLSITPRVLWQEIDMDGFNRQEVYNFYANPYTTTREPVSMDEREQFLLRRKERFNDETLIADLVVKYELDSLELTYVGSYSDRDLLVSRDASALTHSVSSDLSYPTAAFATSSNLRDTTELEQWTHEVRLASVSDNAFQWVAGVFYADTDRIYAQRLPTPGYDFFTDQVFGEGTSAAVANGYGPDSPFNSDLDYNVEQVAVFGEATYAFTDRLDFTVGGRWYDFEDDRSITSGGLFANGDTNAKDTTSSDGFNPRVLAAYDLNDEVTLNAQASQGFRLGGVNDPLNPGLCSEEDEVVYGPFQKFDDETLWNYEIGFKSLFENFSVNAALFYTDIEDLQVNLDAGQCSSRVALNVEEAHTLGGEVEVDAYVTDDLRITFAGSYIEAEFDSDVLDANGDILDGLEEGNRIASVPEWQFSIGATYSFGSFLGSNDTFASLFWQGVGSRYTQPKDQVEGPGTTQFQHGFTFGGATGNEVTELDLELDDYYIVNINAGILYDAWDVQVYVDNVTDENALLSFDRERGGRARLGYRTNQPRTYGVTFRYHF